MTSLLDTIAPLPVSDTIRRGGGRPDKYVHEDKKRVIGVTTVIDILNIPLAKWANDHGLAGRDLSDARKWDRATDIGSYIHDLICATIHGDTEPPPPEGLRPEQQEGLDKCVVRWRDWYKRTDLRFEATELPLVSNTHRFGGTLDAVARDPDERLALLDWKTSKRIYDSYLLQVSAYRLLWNETHEEQIDGGFHLVRFGKEVGDFEYRYYPELDECERVFLKVRELYDDMKAVGKLVGR